MSNGLNMGYIAPDGSTWQSKKAYKRSQIEDKAREYYRNYREAHDGKLTKEQEIWLAGFFSGRWLSYNEDEQTLFDIVKEQIELLEELETERVKKPKSPCVTA